MMKALFFFSLLLICIAINAQNSDGIIGKWKYSSVPNAKELDSAKLKMFEQFFGETSLYLKADAHYTALMMSKEEGSWVYDAASQMLTLTADKGTISQLTAELIAKDTMLLSLAKGKTLTMARTIPGATDEAVAITPKPELASITPQQLCKKWFLHSREVPGRTKEQSQLVTDLFKGTFFNFKPNNTYDVLVGKISESGSWTLDNNNTTIYLAVDNAKKFWTIKKASANELVLAKGNSEEIWTFSTKE
jgi:hypothetical protein